MFNAIPELPDDFGALFKAVMPNVTTERLNVLLVDGDHSDLALMGLAIEQGDTNIWLQTASDTQRAMDYLDGREMYADRQMHPLPDVVILDLDMPLSSGFDFLDWRRASRSSSSVPLVLLSSWAYPGAIQAALSMGANVWFPKPAQLQDWKSLIDQIWQLGRANSPRSTHEGI